MSSRQHPGLPLTSGCVIGLLATLLVATAPAGPAVGAQHEDVEAPTRAARSWSSLAAPRPAHRIPRPAPPADALHVSRRGNDQASGSKKSPLRTIGEAVDRAHEGDTVVVHAGSYHESIKLETSGVTLMAAPRATVWLDGSRPVTNWTPTAGTWVSSGWTPEFDSSPTYSWGQPDNDAENWQFINRAHPMAAHPDQVWMDEAPLVQVGSLGEVRPGTFFVDEPGDQLFVGSDPTGRDVRASAIAKGLSVRAADTLVTGIGVRRFANSVPHMGAVTIEAPRVTFQDVEIAENGTGGLHVMERDVRLVGVSLVDNGMVGMTASGADGLLLDGLRVTGNNREQFNPSPSAGGAKIGRGSDVVVRNSLFDHNLATGLWFDESVYGIEVVGSRMTNNASHGISLELSGKVLLAGNVVAGNLGHGVKVNDTSSVTMWNNTFTGNHREINVVQDDRDLDSQGSFLDYSLPLTFRNGPVVLRNNVIARTASGSDCLLCVEDYSGRMSAEDMSVSARGNLYQRLTSDRPRVLVLWSRGDDATPFTSFKAFRTTTGQEQPGRGITGKRVLRSDDRLTAHAASLARTTAVRIPAAIAALLGVPRGSRILGAG